MTDIDVDTETRPVPDPYMLICYNPLPWGSEGMKEIEYMLPPSNMNVYFAAPGNDPGGEWIAPAFTKAGYKPLARLPRADFLRWLRHAEAVYGNSSCLCYEAPLWHPDNRIHFVGMRNRGRKIVRWDTQRFNSPSENVMLLLKRKFP